jgi:hypothetical protein
MKQIFSDPRHDGVPHPPVGILVGHIGAQSSDGARKYVEEKIREYEAEGDASGRSPTVALDSGARLSFPLHLRVHGSSYWHSDGLVEAAPATSAQGRKLMHFLANEDLVQLLFPACRVPKQSPSCSRGASQGLRFSYCYCCDCGGVLLEGAEFMLFDCG